MFKDNPEVTRLDDQIFIYKSFVDSSTLSKIIGAAGSKDNVFQSNAKNTWFNNKLTVPMPELFEIYKKIKELVSPEYTILPNLSITRIGTGEDMYVHADTPGEGHEDDVTSDDPYNTCHVVQYGVVLYLNDDYQGGEIFYPERGLSIKPSSGDLIIHSAFDSYRHGVKTVTAGTRYVYSNFMVSSAAKDIPSITMSEVGQLGLEPRTERL